VDIKKLKTNKLKILVAILAVAVIIADLYVYGQYKMAQMDNYMHQARQLLEESDKCSQEANNYVSADNIDGAKIKVDEAIELTKKAIELQERGYQYADGPYKEIIELLIEENQLYLKTLESWKERLECIKEGDYASALELKAQEEDIYAEINKIDARKETIKSKHPDVKEHIEKYW